MPAALMEQVGLRPGDYLEFVLETDPMTLDAKKIVDSRQLPSEEPEIGSG